MVQKGDGNFIKQRALNPLLGEHRKLKAEVKYPDCECSWHVNFSHLRCLNDGNDANTNIKAPALTGTSTPERCIEVHFKQCIVIIARFDIHRFFSSRTMLVQHDLWLAARMSETLATWMGSLVLRVQSPNYGQLNCLR